MASIRDCHSLDPGSNPGRGALSSFLRFLFELRILKKEKHKGFYLVGCSDGEVGSVAEHSWRTAVIGYILAKMENYPNPYEVSTICVFHDIAESRIGDLHRVAKRYVKVDKEKAIKEQTQQLGETGEEIAKLSLRSSYKDLNDKAGIIARDADLVEQAISAYELVRKGYKSAEEWIENVKKNIKTKSAKELLNEMEKKQVDPFFWWEGLKVKKAD